MDSSYQEPIWAVKPSHKWTLTEIKGGVEMASYPLHQRATTLLGRAVEMVQIPLHHESISRRHARIAFDVQGIPWLKDLQSAHGVFVNKRRLPPEASSGKAEVDDTKKGGRGVMLFPGDVLKFGASTRIYTLEGPAEFERGAMQAKMQQQKLERQEQQRKQLQKMQHMSSSNNSEEFDAGASSWGISMSDDENDEEENKAIAKHSVKKELPTDLQVPEKHRKSLEKLNGMKFKLSNLETEDSRIRRKGELTEGQEKQLQRNAEREEALKTSIAELEEKLFDILYPDKAARTKQKTRSSSMNDPSWEEEDDFFDRTKNSHVSQSMDTTEAESEASLIAKWKKLFEEQKFRRFTSLVQANSRLNALQEKLNNLQGNRDEDAFFVQNDFQLAEETRTKIENDIKDCDLSMDEAEKLLRIVSPRLQWNRDTGYIGEGPPPTNPAAPDLQSDMPPPALPKKVAVQPPSLPSEEKRTPELDVTQSSPASKGDEFEMPAPKRKRVLGPSLPPPSVSSSSTELCGEKPKEHNQTKPTVAGTLSLLNSASKVTRTMSSQAASLSQPKAVGQTKGQASSPQVDVWEAPKDQDGSGKTKLNDKFAGRY